MIERKKQLETCLVDISKREVELKDEINELDKKLCTIGEESARFENSIRSIKSSYCFCLLSSPHSFAAQSPPLVRVVQSSAEEESHKVGVVCLFVFLKKPLSRYSRFIRRL